MKYDGVQCPVCLKAFDSSSDVVVCPECGTPHHRECYEKTGDCINAAKHSADFAWVNPVLPAVAEVAKTPEKPQTIDNPTILTKENMPKNGVIGEMPADPMAGGPIYREIKGNEKIGEYTVDEYASVIKQNVPKFMPRFMMFSKTNRKVSWNWAAFFFGPFWFAYRRMYGYAAAALLLVFFIPFVFFNSVTDYYNDVTSVYGKALTQQAYTSAEDMNKAAEALQDEMPEQPFALTASSYVEMAVDVICALFGNYLYMKKCTKVLDKAKAIEDAEKRKVFIARRGGRTLLGIVLLLVGFYLVALVVGLATATLGTDLATFLQKFIK